MKKILPLLFLILSPSIFAGSAILYNASKKHAMGVTYMLCQNKASNVCMEKLTILIKKKGYTILKPINNYDLVTIVNANITSKSGIITSWGDYLYPVQSSSCKVNMVEGTPTYIGIIVLDDFNESPYILCNTSFAQTHIH